MTDPANTPDEASTPAPDAAAAADSAAAAPTAAAATAGAPAAPVVSAPVTPARRLFWPIIVIAVAVVVADQLTKWWAISALSGGGNTPVLGNLLSFQLVYNAGAAFSTGVGFTWVFTIVAGLVAVFVGWLAWRVGSKAWAVGLGLVLGGATTHFGDRLLRPPTFGNGHVVDFINYAGFFIGNVADIAIVVGVAILLVTILRGIHLSGEVATPPADPAKESASPE